MRPVPTIIVLALGIFSCKPRDLPREDAQARGTVHYDPQNPFPTALMFHYGDYAQLQKNESVNRIPDPSWKLIIERHPRHRQGLFVGVHPAYNERYVTRLPRVDRKGNNAPWLMGTKIAERCLKKERVLAKPWRLHEDSRFSSWNENLRKEFRDRCAMQAVTSATYLIFRERFNSRNSRCGTIINRFIDHFSIDIVQDALWPEENFWIVLNPSCIENIQASSDEVLKLMASPEFKGYWQLKPFTTNFARHLCINQMRAYCKKWKPGVHATYILLRAMHEAKEWRAADLGAIRADASTSDIVYELEHRQVKLKDILTGILDKAIVCLEKGRVETFKQALEGYLNSSHTLASDRKIHAHNYHFYAEELEKIPCEGQVPRRIYRPSPKPKPKRVPKYYKMDWEFHDKVARHSILRIVREFNETRRHDIFCRKNPYRAQQIVCRVYTEEAAWFLRNSDPFKRIGDPRKESRPDWW